ncbi:GntR family transcriptional regulator [Allostreptomyces psammosilenae]|uniref:DNA-binding GntR family transcriptional regulator n=1 Tax=Allostreptomyces psammosilenae TaxID=1892865 RepID=A0A852ZUI2_9ACTN|nr:GntR family transcriptional regulator [Allostreptomyces psammosilenae]NYI05227.1 DNA-binding GntR family transcriptional regulator [Allostreptomyces psammosilenae]
MPSGYALVHRSSLREQIARALRDDMVTGRLPAGERFTVRDIAERYGVSATPVREALVELAALQLVEIVHHRGFQVRQQTWEDFDEILDARRVLTEGMLASLPGRVPDGFPEGELTTVRRRAMDARRAAEAGDVDVMVVCDLRYWWELNRLLSNRRVADFADNLRVLAWMFLVPRVRPFAPLRGHLWGRQMELVEGLQRGDWAAVAEEMRAYHRFAAEGVAPLRERSAPSSS